MSKIKLSEISTKPSSDIDKETIKAKTNELVEKINLLQVKLYAEGKQALLIVLQGMDASGKDGVINKVMHGVNPQGCRVYSFKKPTE